MSENPLLPTVSSANDPAGNSPQTDRVIAAILGNPTLAAAAAALGINTATLWRILKRPDVKEQYRNARRQIVSHAIALVQQLTSKAAQALGDVVEAPNSPTWARIFSAKAILELAVKAIEFEDFDARLSEIEATQKELKEKGIIPHA